MSQVQNVAILGASKDPSRYAHKAFQFLREKGHRVFPVSPNLAGQEIEGVSVVSKLKELTSDIDTLTLYVKPKISSALLEEIISSRPKRLIFNPGTENPALEKAAREAGIETIEACTLVMLRLGQF